MTKPIFFSLLLLSSSCLASELIISKQDQTFKFIKENKVYVGRVSTGKKNHETPSGQFIIHTKNKDAYSNKYKAQMKFALFFIGGKFAIHQGKVSQSKVPNSHGCIRLSKRNSEFLYNNVSVGTLITIR